MNAARRASYVFLCAVPLLNAVSVGVRAFRVPGIYQAVGVAYFAAIVVAAWITGASAIGKSELALELISRGNGLIADDIVVARGI